MDYPSIENFLAPIYAKGADSNWSKYDNPEFDAKLAEAAAAPTTDEANTLYQEAEAMLAADFPTAPMWYPATVVGWSDKVTNVKVNAFGVLDYSAISDEVSKRTEKDEGRPAGQPGGPTPIVSGTSRRSSPVV